MIKIHEPVDGRIRSLHYLVSKQFESPPMTLAEFRAVYDGIIMGNCGYTKETAEERLNQAMRIWRPSAALSFPIPTYLSV